MIKNCKGLMIMAAVTLLTVMASCRDDKFHVKGEVYGAEGKTMSLEKSDFVGRWTSIDSVKINRNGDFFLSFPAPASPDIYRLSLNGNYIYFPVDSTETVILTTSLKDFGRDFTLEGSQKAKDMELFEKEVQSLGNIPVDSMADFKKNVYTKYMMDSPGSIVNFYILTKTIGDKALFNPADPQDAKYFGAVATGFQAVRPDDPHTALLEETTLNAYRQRSAQLGRFRELAGEEVTMIDLELQDETGKMVKLSDVAGHGKPVALIFSVLTHPDSPALNYELAQIYNRHKDRVEFYNVSLDPDQYTWRESAVNLPWITVYAPAGLDSPAAIQYNINEVPTFFIYNAEGDLTSRPLTLQELDNQLK